MSNIPFIQSQGPDEDGSAGDVLLFLHGIGGDNRSFNQQLPAFADRWRAVSWDMPGYGQSAQLDEMTFPALADAVAGLLDHLDAPRAVIVGHSMGGMVAQEFVARHPGRTAALVLSSTSPAFGKPGKWRDGFLGQRLAPLDKGLSPADFAAELVPNMMADNPPAEAVVAAMASMSELSAETYRAALHCLVTFNRRDNLENIDCPTLALAADMDEAAPAGMMEKMAGNIPDCRYHCLSGVGHLANLEDPENFNKAVRSFLNEVA
ncbi:MAG: alpha/beta fold hydrolase [Rhodospirillaceae bacterium]|jgi:3-oxoadipate enol-lactonase|nr:alpha/beta fold hydrolase [Rhodospirillaceae bacterium]MBT5080420.1 alpha/beta fold hydrolase [Rhodospirillaceae bacterium]MBT5523251.1 alpha/beta fold hydrolase [Rhodospirillaceae bacterium]MBT5878190.1 alpha/beta fold hydrolase [Rhodospirillaceae bacterium]MBT6591402.1 alpha/beta fold hydrolase [Rhodospirillaceae bacterium]